MNIRLSFCDLRHCEQAKKKMFTQRSKKRGIRVIGRVFGTSRLYVLKRALIIPF